MAAQPRHLSYSFPIRLQDAGGSAQTFSLTLTREVLEGAARITINYHIMGVDNMNNLPPNSMGMMRRAIIEEGLRRPSLSPRQQMRLTRYLLSCREAIWYDPNSRNLEVFWKPIIRYFLDDAIDGMETCDVREELPIWLFYDARDQLPLNATVSMPRGGGKTVYPDLSVIMRLGSVLDDLGLPTTRFLPIIVELKRAVSRSLTIDGYPDPARPEGRLQLIDSFGVAQTQIEFAGCLQMRRVNQPHIILMTAVGPWIRVCCASRADLLAMTKGTDRWVAEQIEALEGEDEGTRDADDALQGNNVWATGTTPSDDYLDGPEFDDISALYRWSPPAMLGTTRADQYLTQIQLYLRRMLTTGRME